MAAQQKPKPTHAIDAPLPPPPPSPQSTVAPSPPPQTSEKVASTGGKVLATPAVRKIAMDHNVRRITWKYYSYYNSDFSNLQRK